MKWQPACRTMACAFASYFHAECGHHCTLMLSRRDTIGNVWHSKWKGLTLRRPPCSARSFTGVANTLLLSDPILDGAVCASGAYPGHQSFPRWEISMPLALCLEPRIQPKPKQRYSQREEKLRIKRGNNHLLRPSCAAVLTLVAMCNASSSH